MRALRSLSFRLALTYVGLFCISIAALLSLFYWASVLQPIGALRRDVAREAELMAQTYMVDGPAALDDALERRAKERSDRKAFHAFITPTGQVLTANLSSWPPHASARWLEVESDIHRNGNETDYFVLTHDRRFADGARLLVGRDFEDIADTRELLREAASWILGGAVLLGLAGGLLMSRAIGQRIEAVNDTALTVMRGDLSGRIPIRGSGDDFDRLGETLNLMLTRIETLFETVRRVSDNVAHELRTPLTRLLLHLEQLENSDREDADRNVLMKAATHEARRLSLIFDALLRISRIESGRYEARFREVDIGRLVADVAEFYAPDAESAGLTLSSRAATGLTVRGDADLLFQAVANLVDNAIKYTNGGGVVVISAEIRGDGPIISVADNGSGMSDEALHRATERFYRAPGTSGKRGEGLGLTLVEAIATLHGASVVLKNRNLGLVAEMSWPIAAAH